MIQVTPSAAREIRSAQTQKGALDCGLRIQVVGGGCEGFLYDLLFVDGPEPEDAVFESEGIKLFVSTKALAAVDGTTIDHASTPYGIAFVFDNPRAQARCSCGASFSI